MRHTTLLVPFAALALACGAGDAGGEKTAPTPDPEVKTEGCPKTGFQGDDYCLAPPDPAEGIQLHVGPKDYGDPGEVDAFLLPGGEENVECFHLKAPNTDTYTYFEQANHMRPGSHHMIIRVLDADLPDGWGECERGSRLTGIPGSQTSKRTIPEGEIAPENEGLGRTLPPNAQVQVELHYVNTTDEPILREAWINLYEKDPAEVTGTIRTIFMIGGIGMNVAPRTREVLGYGCDIGGPSRIFELFGHFHAHTERFTAWRVRGEQRDLIYESYDWAEPDTLAYDSANGNDPPDADRRIDGGWSGTLEVSEGDRFEWECDINNTLDDPLRFANEAYTAEMCILVGGYVADDSVDMTCVDP